MNEKRFPTGTSLLLYFLQGSKKYFAIAVVAAVCMQAVSLINPKIISFTVDSVIGDTAPKLNGVTQRLLDAIGGIAVLKSHLWIVAIAVLCVALVQACISFVFRVSNVKGAETLVMTIRNRVYSHIERLPYAWFSENHTGDIIQRCTSDVETIKVFLSEQLTSLIRIVVLIVMALFFMSSIHVRLTLISAAFIPIIVGYSFYFHSKIGQAFMHADEEEGKLSAIAQENLTGVRVVRAFGRESYERTRFEKQNKSYTQMWVDLMRLLTQFWVTGDLFSGLQVLAVTAFGAYFTVHGQMSAGNYIAFVSYNSMLVMPIRQIGRVIANMSKANISIERIAYIMNAEEEKDCEGAVESDMRGDIVFEHVNYQYENGTGEILQDINMTIPQGKTIGILGGTGSGKSTLMYLLDRLYSLKEGEGRITVNGVDLSRIQLESVRNNIGIVLQEPYLFSRSLSENIKIARQTSSMDDILKASRIASLDDAVKHFDEGYDTYVGERGVTLSGGQKQRTAIAQMLIRKPPIMIFDDSLSAVDAETDAKIRAALKEHTGDSTVILIAHRITTLMAADEIYVLDEGKITEHGTHDSLLEQNGIYRKIYDLQMSQE